MSEITGKVLNTKSQFEHVAIPEGCSIRVLNRRIPEIPFEWHHHPEYELTLTLNSRGWRFIADHIGEYDSHDVVLIPSEMPHTWASVRAVDESGPHVAIVVWFTEGGHCSLRRHARSMLALANCSSEQWAL